MSKLKKILRVSLRKFLKKISAERNLLPALSVERVSHTKIVLMFT